MNLTSTIEFGNKIITTRQPQGILSRFMPFSRPKSVLLNNQNVPKLSHLARDKFLCFVERKLETPVQKTTAMQSLKQHYQAMIPPQLRQCMLDYILASGRVYNSVDINIFEFLMDCQIRRVCVRHVRKWYRELFLQILKEHGSGLHSLYLEEIAVEPDCGISLAQSLITMRNLTHVSLRFVCDDASLWSLGRNCSFLQELDVEGSAKVTDLGIQTLCLRGATLPTPQYQPRIEHITTAEISCLSVVYSYIEKLLCLSENFSENSVIGISWLRASFIRRARKNPCCCTLQLLNLRATSVTIIKSVPLIETCCLHAKIYVSSEKY